MFEFRPAKRENVGLLISFAGGTGSGKTFSALRVATGLAAGEPFCGIDTESRRMLHYADKFRFEHGELSAPFTPMRYAEAIEAAVAAKFRVIVVDSASHEHAGDGGLLDMQEAELSRMAGDDWKKREACKMAAWVKPKMAHKRMVQRLLGLPPHVHLILCLRAEAKIEMVKRDGKMEVVPKQSLVGLDGWIPVCEKTLPFEMTMSFLLTADRPGIPRPIKLQEQHRPMVPLDRPLDESVGSALAAWATGGAASPAPPTDGRLVSETTILEHLLAGPRSGFVCADGRTYGTEDWKMKDAAGAFVGTGEPVEIQYEQHGSKFRMIGVSAVEPADLPFSPEGEG